MTNVLIGDLLAGERPMASTPPWSTAGSASGAPMDGRAQYPRGLDVEELELVVLAELCRLRAKYTPLGWAVVFDPGGSAPRWIAVGHAQTTVTGSPRTLEDWLEAGSRVICT